MINFNTNLTAQLVASNLKTSTSGLDKAIERMTTGFKLNHAKDNAANFSISTSLTTKLGAYNVALDNASMGLDMIQTASSSLSLISNLGSRLQALATQANNGTYDGDSLDSIQSEASSIVQEMFRIANTTQYNGMNLFGGGQTTSNIATNAIATLAAASTQATTTQTAPKAIYSGFIEKVERRDTSSMTALGDCQDSTTLAEGTYSISSVEELSQLAKMSQSGLISKHSEFVLAGDIDLYDCEDWSPIELTMSTFDGNGYKIKNLGVTYGIGNGLFGRLDTSTVRNLGIDNSHLTSAPTMTGLLCSISNNSTIDNCFTSGDIDGSSSVGGLVGESNGGVISNSYAKVNVQGDSYIGGLIGLASGTSIENSYATGDVQGRDSVGGLVGRGDLDISGCYSKGTVTGDTSVGGLVGSSDITTINNSYSTSYIEASDLVGGLIGDGGFSTIDYSFFSGTISANDQAIGGLMGRTSGGSISNSYVNGNIIYNGEAGSIVGNCDRVTLKDVYFTQKTGLDDTYGMNPYGSADAQKISAKELNELVAQGVLYSNKGAGFSANLQVGIHGSDSDKIEVSIDALDISSLEGLDLSKGSALDIISEFMKSINEQQTVLGSVENRLTSAVESIGVNIDNLTSTQSTIRDADIAKESSEYIRNQILQQAAATLLATANQTPSIALQLI